MAASKEVITTEVTTLGSARGCKRRAKEELHARTAKKQKVDVQSVISTSSSQPTKVYSIFQSVAERKETFRFLARKGRDTVLHGVHLSPEPRAKVAAFDLDGTLISTKGKNPFPKDRTDWKWWNAVVPTRLKHLHEEGYAVVIFSNQGGLSGNSRKRRTEWEAKVGAMAKQLSDVPFHIFAATEDNEFRKPRTGMWACLNALFSKQSVIPDLRESFYVGDAAGRPGDHSKDDLSLARALSIAFYTPEEFFLESPSTSDQ